MVFWRNSRSFHDPLATFSFFATFRQNLRGFFGRKGDILSKSRFSRLFLRDLWGFYYAVLWQNSFFIAFHRWNLRFCNPYTNLRHLSNSIFFPQPLDEIRIFAATLLRNSHFFRALCEKFAFSPRSFGGICIFSAIIWRNLTFFAML